MKFNAEHGCINAMYHICIWDFMQTNLGIRGTIRLKEFSVSLLCEKAWSASKVNPLDLSSSEEVELT